MPTLPRRSVHEQALPLLHPGRTVQQLVGGDVREHKAHDLPRVEVLGNPDGVLLQDADSLRIRAPYGQRADTVSQPQP